MLGSGQGWTRWSQGWRDRGAPAPGRPLPGTRFLPWSGPIQSFIRNRQEQATIRRPGEIARLSLIELGLAGLTPLPNQGTQVHPKKARPATVLFRRPFCRSGCRCQPYSVIQQAKRAAKVRSTKVRGVKLSPVTLAGWLLKRVARPVV